MSQLDPLFTSEEANKLRKEYEAGHTLDELADRYFVHKTTVRKVILDAGATLRRRGPRLGTKQRKRI